MRVVRNTNGYRAMPPRTASQPHPYLKYEPVDMPNTPPDQAL
jgi:hypothetical protein